MYNRLINNTMKTAQQSKRKPSHGVIRLKYAIATTANPIINPFRHL